MIPCSGSKFSVAKEQRALVERFEKNAASAHQTLDLTDGALQQAVNVVTRISELAIQAGNDTYGIQDRKAIETEVDELTNVLVSIANTRDLPARVFLPAIKPMWTHSKCILMERLPIRAIRASVRFSFQKICL